MSIYTKTGDGGLTMFFGCGLIPKDDPRIEAFGALDELNSVIGLTLCYIEEEKLRETLTKIQNDLFQVGADLGGSLLEDETVPRISKEHVEELEQTIDVLHEKLGMPTKFVIPGGTKQSAFLHLCRVITRRAERSLVKVSSVISFNPELLKYINRLSDLLYVLARDANKEVNVKEQQPIYKYYNSKD
ncbi:MAG: cob(I)yrinic acid a,c-diamide adenosyltransferase [archaeon]|nr:cob(I)yrinic acid a,c-diamide adenosyltransferase [archaeon]